MSVHTEALSMGLLEQVLSRLGLADPPAPTLDGLRTNALSPVLERPKRKPPSQDGCYACDANG